MVRQTYDAVEAKGAYMAQELSGKIAVVTGGGRGIGYAVAQRLLEEGAKVAFCALRQKSVDDAVASLSELGEVVGVVADISVLNDVRNFFDVVKARFGGADVLVNNAAIRTYQAVADLSPADWDRMLAVNLTGAFYCSHEILPMLKQRGGGDVINISSLSSTSPFAGGAGYNASKAGLNGLSDATMLDHRYDTVRVSCVLPGSTRTDFNADSEGGNRDGDEWKVAPEDIAEVVATLLKMPRRTTISRVDVKPSRPPRKGS
jgi:NAD(P)-dependent dehydrogenase (short-subunit alcohol dehydrogenase family)